MTAWFEQRSRHRAWKEASCSNTALARVALEDDYIEKLLALRGTVGQDVDLEF